MIDLTTAQLRLIKGILSEVIPSLEVRAFGSRLRWETKPHSDLDIAVMPGRKSRSTKRLIELKEAFEESNLPFSVDIVDWEQISEGFRKIIERDYEVIQEASPYSGEFGEAVVGGVSDWSRVKLGELLEITSSKRIFRSDYVNSGVPFFRSKEVIERAAGSDVSTELFISRNKFEEIKNRFGAPEVGDILLTSVGTLGVPYRVQEGEEFYFKDGNLTWFRSFSDNVNGGYLLLWLRSNLAKIAFDQITIGSTQKALTIVALKGVEIDLPNVPEQIRIAEILSSLDEKIELNRKQNRSLEAIAQALFKHWFVDFEFPDPQGQPYKSKGGAMQNSELGEIPVGWEVVPFSEAVDLIGGGTPKTSVSKYWKGDIPWFSVVDAPNGSNTFVIQTEKQITQAGVESSSTKVLRSGTTIVSARGTVGRLALVGKPMAMNQSCYGIQGKVDNSDYFTYLSLQRVLRELRASAHGSVFDTITRTTFENLKVTKPIDLITQDFEQEILPLFQKLLLNCNHSVALSNLRDTLLPKLMSGELRVAR